MTDEKKHRFLPDVNVKNSCKNLHLTTEKEACPCCGYITIPKGDNLAYICPVCFWEIDVFLHNEDEKSDQNHGLTLKEARENYQKLGAVKIDLQNYCRMPTANEYPNK